MQKGRGNPVSQGDDQHVRDLDLEYCWTSPCTEIAYLGKNLAVGVVLKNNLDLTITVGMIRCSFQVEDGLSKHENSVPTHISIEPGGRSSSVMIPVTADLRLRRDMNYATVRVTYTVGGTAQEAEFGNPDTDYVMLRPTHPPKNHFFVSHKDPQNTPTARELARHLQKIGFGGYVAEDDPRPGQDIWRDKIMPSIKACKAMIVLWTAEARNDPARIFQEIENARKLNKKIVLVAENAAGIPPMLDANKEYLQAEEKITQNDLVRLVTNIYSTYKQGGF